MGLMDKFKNLFTDEEIIEEDEEVDTVEIKEVKKEEEVNKLPTFMREKIEKEEKKAILNSKIDEFEEEVKIDKKTDSGFELPRLEEKNSFKFPMDLSDNDFVETRSRQSIHQKRQEVEIEKEQPVKLEKKIKPEIKVADLYKDKKQEREDVKPKFRATPIISPIYGILDKNYTSGDIANSSINNLEERRHSKSVDFDSVRKKAYGNLTQEIKENLMCENCEYLKEAKECKKEKEKYREASSSYDTCPEYSYEILDDDKVSTSYRDVTLDEATENYFDYGVAYEKQSEPEPEYNEVVISNFEEEEKPKKVIPPVKSSINLLSTLKKSMGEDVNPTPKKEENLELTDDLFDLIDSMYDERNENK